MSEKSIAEKVAEACGMVVESVDSRGGARIPKNGDYVWFDPDVDCNDAVLAAEKYGLFLSMNCELHGLILDPSGKTGWGVTHREPHAATKLIGCGTFCEAICRAILHLESKKPAA